MRKIKLGLCIVTLILCILGLFKVIDTSVAVHIALAFMVGIICIDGVDAVKTKRKLLAIVEFTAAAIILAIVIYGLVG